MRPLNLYRYIMIGGALNGRTYQLPHDLGPQFRLPPSEKAIDAWMKERKRYDDSSTGGWMSPAHAPKPPDDIVYNGLVFQIDTLHADDVNAPDEVTHTRYCVPESWGTDPEKVAKEMIRYFSRMNKAAFDAVTNAGQITPEIMRLGNFVGVFHK